MIAAGIITGIKNSKFFGNKPLEINPSIDKDMHFPIELQVSFKESRRKRHMVWQGKRGRGGYLIILSSIFSTIISIFIS